MVLQKNLFLIQSKIKKHVVTANKSLISKHGNELAKLAENKAIFGISCCR